MEKMLPNLVIINYSDDDLKDVIELWNLVYGAETKFEVDTFVRNVIGHKNFDREGFIIARMDDEIAGFVLACVRKVPLISPLIAGLEEKNGYIPAILVHPEYRRRGIGSLLLSRALDYLKSKGKKEIYLLGDDLPAPLKKIRKSDTGVIAFFEKFGFQPYMETTDMKISLTDFKLPEWYPPLEEELRSEDIELKTYEPSDKERFLAFMEKYFYGPWYTWERDFVEKGENLDELKLAVKGEEIIGFATCGTQKYFGPIGVKPECRRKGVGTMLLVRYLEFMRDSLKLKECILLGGTQVMPFYRKVGFKATEEYIHLKKTL